VPDTVFAEDRRRHASTNVFPKALAPCFDEYRFRAPLIKEVQGALKGKIPKIRSAIVVLCVKPVIVRPIDKNQIA
jgi:hypothetical protein